MSSNDINSSKNNICSVKNQGNKLNKDTDSSKLLKGGNGIPLKATDDMDSTPWDDICKALSPSWCKQGRTIILGKRNPETFEWELQTSKHQSIDKFFFGDIQAFYYRSIMEKKELSVYLWGKLYVKQESKPIYKGCNVIWVTDCSKSDGLAIVFKKDLCVVFFYETENEGELDDEQIMSFVDTIKKIMNLQNTV
ncbi:hypothetical protein OJ253_1379 [Cryptosporidium canis]|uniref:Uncharacterized protein n=1 Tax=Cryptosporidium canis TaxID=195482 RepID=A0A9D5HVB8_9CRYT|nr:hypothetical protein OJ253_1379 [Cryptosporidium canis]